MKNKFLAFALFFLAKTIGAQVPHHFNYQSVVRDSSGQILTARDIYLKFVFSKSGTAIFEETDTVQTTLYGIANTQIGDGSPAFSTIDWAGGGIEFSVFFSENGTNFEQLGGEQTFSIVPYAEFSNYSNAAGSVKGMDMLFVGAMPVFGSFEGQAVIEGSDWQQVTRTSYSTYEQFFEQFPTPPGMLREYYLLIDYADNVAASSNAATNWRFWMDWTPAPGHQFSLPSVWGDLGAGRPIMVKVPSINDQTGASADYFKKYWRLEARVSGQFAAASARVKSIQVVAYDVRNGQAATVDLNTDFPGGQAGAYELGGIAPSLRFSDNGNWNKFSSPLEIDLRGRTGPAGRDGLWLTSSDDNDASVIVSNKTKIALWDRTNQNLAGLECGTLTASKMGVATSTPQATLDVNGDLRTKCVSIIGGCDIYERAQSIEDIPSGELIVSDFASGFNHVKRASKAYDRKVVGVVSGGGDITPGIELTMPGKLDGSVKMVIAGRVMVKVTGEVHEGDLLTTSDVPGRAMAVKNRKKSIGAVIGKAISEPDANGMVLVIIHL